MTQENYYVSYVNLPSSELSKNLIPPGIVSQGFILPLETPIGITKT